MIGIVTKHTAKLIASAISFVPSATGRTVLRGLPRVFPFQPNPFDLATPFEQISGIGVLPMGQPSVHCARKRSALAIFDPLEVFDDNHSDLTEVNLFDLSRQFFLDLLARVFLSFVETLNLCVKFLSDMLAVREDQAVAIVGVPTVVIAALAALHSHFPHPAAL